MIEILPLTGLPEITAGTCLAELLSDALHRCRPEPLPGDILVVTQKVVSKAEGRWRNLSDVAPGALSRQIAETTGKDPRLVELILEESRAVVRAAPGVLITRHRSGHVMANAGIDQSNLGRSDQSVLLLPEDADASAAQISHALGMPAVISDSFGRPWRLGVVPVAIGAAGLPALRDLRGQTDREGRVLQVTQIALADMVAAAAGLAMGEAAESIPAALVSGYSWTESPCPASALLRGAEQDLFS